MQISLAVFTFLAIAWVESLGAAPTHGIRLSWQEATPNTSFIIYRGPSGHEIAYATTGVGITTYHDTHGVGGTTYCYVVVAVLNGIESADSNQACAVFPSTPENPTGLTATRF